MKKIFALVAIAIVAVFFAACEGLGSGSKGEVWIQYAFGRTYSSLYYVTYIPDGADGHSGKNIFNQRKGEYIFNGKYYDVFEIPRGNWDIYFEWYQEDWPGGFRNERQSVAFKKGDWIRFDWMGPDYYCAYAPHWGNWPMEE